MLRWIVCALLSLSAATASPRQADDFDYAREAVVVTSLGTFVIQFHADKAPLHVKHFLRTAAAGGYDGTLFHRVVKWGIVQGGDPLSKDPSKRHLWGSGAMNQVQAEISDLKHVRRTVSSVLLPGKPDSGGNQFFICVTPQPQLDGQFSPFGTVVQGIEVVDRISEAPADETGIPLEPPVIQSVTLRPAGPPPQLPFTTVSAQDLSRYRALLETSLGSIELEFLPDLAPNHVRNFLRLSEAGFYDGTSIHRVVRDFVLQGGDLSTRQPPLPDFRQSDLVRRLQPEFNDTSHVKGVLSMARSDELDSAETSFFICLGDATGLDGEYTAFGRVVSGLEVLDVFQDVPVNGETPVERLELKKVTLRKLP